MTASTVVETKESDTAISARLRQAFPDARLLMIFENRGYPFLPCETGSKFDDDGDGKINDGCPQAGSTPETGAECENEDSARESETSEDASEE